MKFPILGVVKESLDLVRSNLGKAFLSFLFYILGPVLILFIVGILGALSSGGSLDTEAIQAGDYSSVASPIVLLLILPAFFLIVMVITHVFNSWVVVGATGHGRARIPGAGEAFKRSAINALKFILVAIPLGIATLLVFLLTAWLGLSSGLLDTSQEQSQTAAYLTTITPSVILVVVQSLIFSVFSANFTYTALGSTAEGVEHPHTLDFAVVLMVLYGIAVLVPLLVALTGIDILLIVVQLIVSFWSTFAVAVAHGVRYRACSDDHGESVLAEHLPSYNLPPAEVVDDAPNEVSNQSELEPAEQSVPEKPLGNSDSVR